MYEPQFHPVINTISNGTKAGVPPQSLEAEKSVLGSLIIENDAIARVVEILNPDDFHRDTNKKIFNSILTLYERGEVVDIITISEELKRKNEFDNIGGAVYIDELIGTVPTAANVEYYARIVQEKAILRQLLNSAISIISDVYESTYDINDILDKAESTIFNISKKRTKKEFIHLKDYLHESIEKIEKLYHGKGKVTGVSTGFELIDEMTSGFHPGELIIIAARPGMGKTSICLSIAQNVAIREKNPIAFFSLEMAAEQLVMRMLSTEARVDLQRLRTGRLFDSDWPKLTIAAGVLAEAPIYIDDTALINVLEIRAKVRRLSAEIKTDLKLIIIDYLQMMRGRGRVENRQQEISEISSSLKALSKELMVPVLVVSQLSRAPERRGTDENRPQLSDLRESGAIEQDADLVAFIYREAYYKKDAKNPNEAEVIIAKQRNGPTGTAKLAFIKECARFENLLLRPTP